MLTGLSGGTHIKYLKYSTLNIRAAPLEMLNTGWIKFKTRHLQKCKCTLNRIILFLLFITVLLPPSSGDMKICTSCTDSCVS